MRAGAQALSLLAVPLHTNVLLALEQEPLPLMDLRRAVGSPPQTTMRGHLRSLTDIGILERRREPSFPGSVDYELAPAGHELMRVMRTLTSWLAEAPEGPPVEIGSTAAKGTIKALIEGWNTGVVRALAAKPLSLTELSSIIPGLSYPSLERRLGSMRLAGQIEPIQGNGRGTPYKPSDWLRRSIAPIAAAARWERRFLPKKSSPLTRIDVESIFLLAVPLVRLAEEEGGVCTLAVESQGRKGERMLAGATVMVDEGRVSSCVSRLEGTADARALGSVAAWLRSLLDGDHGDLDFGGDCAFGRNVLEALHRELSFSRQTV